MAVLVVVELYMYVEKGGRREEGQRERVSVIGGRKRRGERV